MTTALVEKVRWPVDSAGSLMLQFDKYGFVRRFSEVDAAIKALFAAGEQGVWYDPSDIAVASGTLLGSELITNGDLSAGTTGWTPFDSEAEGVLASISVVNGRLRVTNSQSFQGSCYQYLTGLTVGKTYRIEVDAYVGTAPVKIEFFDFYSQPTAATNVTSSTVSGKLVLNAVATNTGMQLKLYVGSSISGQYAEYDNITVKEVTTTYSGGTLFQDAAGTTPVTAVEQPVGLILDKSKGLALGPELVTNGDFSNGTAGWGGAGSVSSGRMVVPLYYEATQSITLVAGRTYQVTFDIDASLGMGRITVGGSLIDLLNTTKVGARYYIAPANTTALKLGCISGTSASFDNISVRELPGNHATQTTSTSRPVLSARVNLLTATETLVTQTVATQATAQTLRFEGAGTVTLSGTATGTYSAGSHSVTTTAGNLTLTVSGTVTKADLRAANMGVGLPAYQRVNTATDYDTAGFPHYLRFDGVDDSLVTNSIDFTATDKMFVSAGVRKLSDAAVGIVVEFSTGTFLNNGAFVFAAPGSTASAYSVGTRGTAFAALAFAAAAPTTNVVGVALNIAGATVSDEIIIRNNGTPASAFVEVAGPAGTGKYGNYPLYIGARAGTSLPFNGHLYSLVVRGAQSTDQQIIDAEKYVNDKTRAY